MATEPARLRFSVERYERMVEAGILTEDDRVELVSGEIVETTPIDPAHAEAVDALTLLLVEGARTSLLYDRNVKLPLYAERGVPEAWLVDIPGGRIEVHREPAADGYQSVQTVGSGGSVSPSAFPDLVVAVDDVLRSPSASEPS